VSCDHIALIVRFCECEHEISLYPSGHICVDEWIPKAFSLAKWKVIVLDGGRERIAREESF
jgi:hypothetical protein